MKRIPTIITAMLMTIVMAACVSPPNASITDGKISNITSAEATTLMKRQQRHEKVQTVINNQKPIVKLVAQKGQPITIQAESFEVFVPLNEELLLAEEADAVSENIQMAREIRGIGRETVLPISIGGMALADRNNARQAVTRQAEIDAESAVKMETLRSQERRDSRNNPIILTIPQGGSASVLSLD